MIVWGRAGVILEEEGAVGHVSVVAQVIGGVRHLATWPGRTTPAVYAAWNLPAWLTLCIISLMRTGARRLERSFFWCTQKNLP